MLHANLVDEAHRRTVKRRGKVLGERRAAAVRDYMRSLGLDSSRMSIASVGEEMATGADEASWAEDRNVTASEN